MNNLPIGIMAEIIFVSLFLGLIIDWLIRHKHRKKYFRETPMNKNH